MLQTKKLVIYPTSRAIRERIKNELKHDSILPKIITIGEFEKKAVLVEGYTFIDQDTRVMLLNEASSFSTFSKLNIDREFFVFLKNSKYLFSFFDELAVELIDINSLQQYDTYASYLEHLEILSTLLEKYKELLREKKYVDKLTLPSLYRLNLSYLKSFENIEFYLEGYLNNYEFKLLLDISKIVPLNLHISTNNFNKKMVDKFRDLNLELENNHDYVIDLSNKKIIYKNRSKKNSIEFITHASQNRIAQVGFVKKRIYDYIELGIDPKNIAIILPNGSFAKFLDLFDDENNLNFAMGESIRNSKLYQKIEAKYDYYTNRNIENRYRLDRLDIDLDELESNQERWNKRLSVDELKLEFLSLVDDEKDDEATLIFHQELHLFSKLFNSLKHQPFHKLLHLFLNRLQTQTIDDTKGGKITVLEPLETRGVEYEAVVIVDFNEGIVPLSSQKDMFLSSELRFLASLPTSTDRENLQKYYYQRIFDRAKYISISYLEDEQNQPSRFLDELDLPKNNSNLPSLEPILFRSHTPKKHYEKDDLILKYDFTKTELSATSLKSFLDCKRSYYFKYIKKLEQAEIPKEDNSDRIIGVLLHNALKEVYTKKEAYFDEEELLFQLQAYLYKESEKQANLRFLVDMWLERLKPFIQKEIERAKNGYRVLSCEERLKLDIDDFKLTGQIDRVDIKDNQLEIIDYKSGKIPKESKKSLEDTSDFQLQFYHLLASTKGKVVQSYYYDLNSAKLVEDAFFDIKLDLLYQRLQELKRDEHNFTMTEDLKKCKHCPYIKICNRLL
jgi:inactivated superfamily I helicase/RecB family exonuclease